jgi:hypothetical protein
MLRGCVRVRVAGPTLAGLPNAETAFGFIAGAGTSFSV